MTINGYDKIFAPVLIRTLFHEKADDETPLVYNIT